MIVAPLELVSARLSQLVIHQGQQNKMNSNTIEAFWTINNNNENMLNLILMSHKQTWHHQQIMTLGIEW